SATGEGAGPRGPRDGGRAAAPGAAARNLEAVADDTRRSVPAGATADHRLSGVPGGVGLAEAHQSESNAVPACHCDELRWKGPGLRRGAGLGAGTPRAAQFASGGAAPGATCRRAI